MIQFGSCVNTTFAKEESQEVQLGQKAALYRRVSTDDQSRVRQEWELFEYAERAGFYRSIARELNISKNTVLGIAQLHLE